jgi:hypothetical protein
MLDPVVSWFLLAPTIVSVVGASLCVSPRWRRGGIAACLIGLFGVAGVVGVYHVVDLSEDAQAAIRLMYGWLSVYGMMALSIKPIRYVLKQLPPTDAELNAR